MHFREIDDPAALLRKIPAELTRRQFVKLSALAGSGLTLGLVLPGCSKPTAMGDASAPFAMPFVHIAPDSTITVLSKHLEAGQGVWTGLPAIVAEELDASWSQMRVASAPAEVPTYGNLAFDPKGRMQGTGGSTSVANSWLQLRRAGATARAMLVQAAAAKWGVPAAEVSVSEGVVSHASSQRKASFGELASDAARLAVPTAVTLKDPARFTLIGKGHLPRLDSPPAGSATR
jgi:isoquinoline 1-oxidoreductase beta subunit